MNYKKTPRNAPSGRAFTDMLFQEAHANGEVTRLMFSHDREVPDDKIIHIIVLDAVESTRA